MDDMRKRARALVAAMTDDEKLGMLSTHHNAAESVGLGEFYIGTEVARGYVGRSADRPSTVFPQPVGLAAAFDKELMYKLGVIAADEARAYYNKDKKGGLALWGPTVDMVRDPRWGRTEEAYGEDVCLAGELTAAYTLGMLGDNGEFVKTVPTLKHFCANNNEANRGSCNAYLPLRLKYEYYYAVFEYGIRFGGARSVMAAYNEINGLPAIMNSELNTILKDEWGMWFAVSDGGDFSQNVTAHRFCETFSEAYKLTLTAGCDVMTDDEHMVRAAAKKALEQGLVKWEDIDRSLERTVYARLRLGQPDNCPYDAIGDDVIDCEAHRQVNRRGAMEQIVLLKNNGILPLKAKPRSIAVVGALADESLMDWYTGYATYENTVLDGIREEYPDSDIAYDSLWDRVAVKAPNGRYLSAKENGEVAADSVAITDSEIFELQDWGENWVNLFSVKYKRYVRLFDDGSLKLHNRKVYDWFTRETFNLKAYGGRTVIEEFLDHRRLVCDDSGELTVKRMTAVEDCCLWSIETVSSGADRAAELADRCELVIYCVGNHPTQVAKECYDRKTLALNIQPGMTKLLCEHDPNTVLALISSYPYSICEENDCAAAVLWSSHAGAELGRAVAQTLSGKNNPSGRLPLTWYRSEHDLPDIMDYDIETAESTYMYFKGKPLYPFGYGLSYSKVKYISLEMRQDKGRIAADITLENTSDTDCDEVVQLYFTMDGSQVSRPQKKLCAFERVHLKAGELKTVSLEVPRHILRIYDTHSGRMIVEGGEYTFMLGRSSAHITHSRKLNVSGESIASRPESFKAETCDRCENIRIFHSKALAESYVRCIGWSGTAVYEGVSYEGKQAVRLKASSVNGIRKLYMTAGTAKLEADILPSDSYDDFSQYELPLPQGTTGSTLTVTLSEGCSLKDIEMI